MRLDYSIDVAASSEQKAVSGELTRVDELLLRKMMLLVEACSVEVARERKCKLQIAPCKILKLLKLRVETKALETLSGQ